MSRKAEEAGEGRVGDDPAGMNFCGECGYSLVALPGRGRCPECGAGYDVADAVVVFGRPGGRRRLRDLLIPVGEPWPWLARGSVWRLLGCWVLSLVAFGVVERYWPSGTIVPAVLIGQLTWQIPMWFRMKFPSDPRAAATAGLPLLQVRAGRRGVGQRRGPGAVEWQAWDRGDRVELERVGEGVHRLRVRRGRQTQLVGGDPADVVIECDAATAEALRERVDRFRREALGVPQEVSDG